MAIELPKKEFLEAVKSTSKRITNVIVDTAVTAAENTRDAVVATTEKVSATIDEKKSCCRTAAAGEV